MKFNKGQDVALCSDDKDISLLKGKKAKVVEVLPSSNANDYDILFGNGNKLKVREAELKEINPKYLQFNDRDISVYAPTNEKVYLVQIDYLYGKVEIEHDDGSMQVVDLDSLKVVGEGDKVLKEGTKTGKFEKIALEIGKFTDKKNKQYGSSVDATYKMVQVLMERYTYDDENYLIPKDLLKHILLQVRMMDKQNRIFNNPSGKGDSESPYRDLTGYSLIGIEMVDK